MMKIIGNNQFLQGEVKKAREKAHQGVARSDLLKHLLYEQNI